MERHTLPFEITPEDVLAYWLDELGPEDWYRGGAELDADVRDRFERAWRGAMEGERGLWLTYPSGSLAYILLTDQFPRNMFRDTEDAFASDPFALAAAKAAIEKGWDMKIDEPARQFFYMPLMHAENLSDQDRAVRLFATRMPQAGAKNLPHAKAHREIIRRYGRFPTRNAALGRRLTGPEREYLDLGGYGTVLRELEKV
ncbi:MAG: DUF924 family protein [Pseudomonadota bacterium]